MKKGLYLLSSILIMIFVPILIIAMGFFITKRAQIAIEHRLITPKNWDAQKIAYKYAPIFFQEVDKKHKTWDYICKANFDDDWDPLNNSSNILDDKFHLDATVYYSILESKTHFFITYTIFHALDWSYKGKKVKKWYENDIKNVQVVVKKNAHNDINGEIIFLTVQGSQDFDIYNISKYSFRKINKAFADENVILLNDNAKIEKNNTHPAIFVEKSRHRIDIVRKSNLKITSNKKLYKMPEGIVYAPSLDVGEISIVGKKVKYSLINTIDSLWEASVSNPQELFSFYNKKRFNYYAEAMVVNRVPIYFNGKQLDGYEENIENPNTTPFCFGKGKSLGNKGELFFNPIRGYRALFDMPNFSLIYIDYPFIEKKY